MTDPIDAMLAEPEPTTPTNNEPAHGLLLFDVEGWIDAPDIHGKSKTCAPANGAVVALAVEHIAAVLPNTSHDAPPSEYTTIVVTKDGARFYANEHPNKVILRVMRARTATAR